MSAQSPTARCDERFVVFLATFWSCHSNLVPSRTSARPSRRLGPRRVQRPGDQRGLGDAAAIAQVAALDPPDPPPRVVCLEWTDPIMVGGTGCRRWSNRRRRRPLGIAGAPSRYASWSDVAVARPEVMVLMPCGLDLEHALELVPEHHVPTRFRRPPVRRQWSRRRSRRIRVFQPARSPDHDGLSIMAAAVRAASANAPRRRRLLEPARDVKDGVDGAHAVEEVDLPVVGPAWQG